MINKTIKAIIHMIKGLGYTTIAVGFTGIAASLLLDGTTIHSKFMIPININDNTESFIELNSEEAQIIQFSKIIILDEAVLMNKMHLDCIDRFCRNISKIQYVPFGGKCVLAAGDFRQCLCISEDECFRSSISICIKKSLLWPLFRKLTLVENIRAYPEEIEFKQHLLSTGEGREKTIGENNLIRIPDRMICTTSLIDEIYGDGELELDYLASLNVAILTPTNKNSLEINEIVLVRMISNIK